MLKNGDFHFKFCSLDLSFPTFYYRVLNTIYRGVDLHFEDVNTNLNYYL